MWAIDVLGIVAALAGWVLIPRWIEFTTSFYRSRGQGPPAIVGSSFGIAVRAACVVIAVFATIALIRN
jgi:hypothetical protein